MLNMYSSVKEAKQLCRCEYQQGGTHKESHSGTCNKLKENMHYKYKKTSHSLLEMKTERHSDNNMSTSLKVHTSSLRRLKTAKQNENDMLQLRNLALTENFQKSFSPRTQLSF